MGVPKIMSRRRALITQPEPKPRRYAPTKYGVLFLVVLAGMLVGSTNYHSNLGLALTFLLGGMGFISILHTLRNFDALEILPGRAENVFAGETARVEILVDVGDRSRRAIGFRFENGPMEVVDLAAGVRNRVKLDVPTTNRGLLDPGNLYVWTDYPYGLFRCRSVQRPAIRAWVYPRPAAGPMVGEMLDTSSDGNKIDGPGMEDFKGLRPYRQGDGLRHVAWKAAARGDDLLTKEFEGAEGGRTVMLDWNRVESGDGEFKLSRLCHQVLTAHQQQLQYGLRLRGWSIPPSLGENHLTQCLEALARHDLTTGT